MSQPYKTVHDLPTPSLVVDGPTLQSNLETMAEVLPGRRLRPHVKAFKSTGLAREQAKLGHTGFCCATVREMVGMAQAGLGEDLLLANESLNLHRLSGLDAMITVAIDSDETLQAAVDAGIENVLIDVNVGLPRCGIVPDKAGALADRARKAGRTVRGCMGYEGHAMIEEDPTKRSVIVGTAMDLLKQAADDVGGDIISAGGTLTFNMSDIPTEIQAGSYALMDSAFSKGGVPFRPAFWVKGTVISVAEGYAVADVGLKALGMDHGNPDVEGGKTWFCSDEHLTFQPITPVKVGDSIRVWPAHVDPTVAYHEHLYIVDGEKIVDVWDIDLRGW